MRPRLLGRGDVVQLRPSEPTLAHVGGGDESRVLRQPADVGRHHAHAGMLTSELTSADITRVLYGRVRTLNILITTCVLLPRPSFKQKRKVFSYF